MATYWPNGERARARAQDFLELTGYAVAVSGPPAAWADGAGQKEHLGDSVRILWLLAGCRGASRRSTTGAVLDAVRGLQDDRPPGLHPTIGLNGGALPSE